MYSTIFFKFESGKSKKAYLLKKLKLKKMEKKFFFRIKWTSSVCAVAMDFSRTTILHIVYVTPKETRLACWGRCRMNTRLNWTSTHVSGALTGTSGFVWPFLSPSQADSCTIESCGTFSHMGVHWGGSLCFSSVQSVLAQCVQGLWMNSRTTREC